MKKKLLIAGMSLFSILFSTKGFSQSPTASFSVSQATVCVGDQIQITDLSSDLPDSWSYTLDASTTSTLQNPTVTYSAPGNYVITLIASNSSGPSAEATMTVVVNPLPNVSAGSPTTVCLGDMVTLSGSGASTYTWSGGISDGVAFTPTGTTTYVLIGQDANGCINSTTELVTVNALPVLSVSGSTTSCFGSAITQTVSGASSYTWSSGSTSNVLNDTPITTGITTYSILGLDALGCSNITTVSVLVNALPTVAVNSGSICSGSPFIISPSGASSYTYSSGSNTVFPTAGETFTITGVDANGCSANAISTVTVLTLPVVSAADGSVCAGTSFVISPSGATSYTFSSGSATVTPSNSSNYSVTGTDANGCVSAASTVSVTVFALPIVTVNSGSVCLGNSFSITPNGATSYTISGNANVVSPTVNSSYTVSGTDNQGCVSNDVISNVTVLALPVVSVNSGSICAGNNFTLVASGASSYTFSSGTNVVNPATTSTYVVTGTSAFGCVSSNSAVAIVTVKSLPSISVTNGTVCSGSSFVITPSGALTYTISGGSFTVSPLSNSSYFVTGTDASGCISASAATSSVTVLALPVISASNGSVCAGSAFTISPSGASSYSISGSSFVVSPATNTTYVVTGTDASGCVSANGATVSVSVNALPVLSISSASSICSGSSATLTVSGASSYLWNNTATTTSIVVSPSSNTSYSVDGTDANGCIGSASKSIVVNALPVITVNSGAICPGNSFVLTPSGASSYTYSSGSATVVPFTNTTYSVTGTDANGCVSPIAAVATVSVVNTLTVTITGTTTICMGQTANITAGGASTYSWSNGATSNSLAVSPTANSSYTVLGASGNCSNIAVVSIVVNALPAIAVNSGVICSGQSFTMVPTGAVSYTFSSGSAVVAPTSNTSYTVNGTDANGCNSAAGAVSTVSVNTSPIISVNSGVICEGQSFVLIPSGASTYSISGGSATVTPAATTVYTVSGTASNGCVSLTNALGTVSVNPNPIVNAGSTAPMICVGESATLTANGANTYVWNNSVNSNSLVINPTVNTTYTVVGTDANTCVGTATFSQVVDACTAIKNNKAAGVSTFNIYPNPSKGVFTLDLSAGASVKVINCLGEVILTSVLENGQHSINLDNQTSGVYFVQVAEGAFTKTVRIVKN